MKFGYEDLTVWDKPLFLLCELSKLLRKYQLIENIIAF